MRENDIRRAFDKITLSEEKKNLIANIILENREVRTGKKVRHVVWKQVAQVCLLLALCVMIIVAPMVFKPAQNNNNAALAEGTLSETSEIKSEIPDDITFEDIINKMKNSKTYYKTISGTAVKAGTYPKESATIEIQYNSQTSEYYEHRKSTIIINNVDIYTVTEDVETYCDGTTVSIYNNETKTFSKDNVSNDDYLFFWLRLPEIQINSYNDRLNREFTITKYLDRNCAVFTESTLWKDPNANTDGEPKYETVTLYYYVDILTGVVLNYESRNEAGDIIDNFKFTEVKFDEDLKVKTIIDAGNQYDDYCDLMVLKENQADHTAIAKQTIGNLQITMDIYKYRNNKGDIITIVTTVKNIGSEPVTLWAPHISKYGIMDSIALSTYLNGELFNLGRILEPEEVAFEIYEEALQPGESVTRKDIYDTNLADEMKNEGIIEVRAEIGVRGENGEYNKETVKTELYYTPFHIPDEGVELP